MTGEVHEHTTKRHALLVGDRATLKDMARIARAAIDDVHVSASPQESPALDWDLVVVDYEALAPEAREVVFDRFASEQDAGKLLLCMGDTQRSDMAALFNRYSMTHLLARSGQVDGEELLVTVQKILRNDLFGVEKYFPWGADLEHFTVQRASERHQVIGAAADFANRKGAQSRFVELFQTAADELITNAVFNAPTDDAGAHCFAHYSRTDEVLLPSNRPVDVAFCTDGRRLGIAVGDCFGSLEAETVISYLGKCFRRGEDQVDSKAGGAGLGLYYLFEMLSQFVVNIRAGERTELIGIIDIRGRYKDFSDRPKSFNVFLSK